jgi:hypothetical protein
VIRFWQEPKSSMNDRATRIVADRLDIISLSELMDINLLPKNEVIDGNGNSVRFGLNPGYPNFWGAFITHKKYQENMASLLEMHVIQCYMRVCYIKKIGFFTFLSNPYIFHHGL